MNLQENFKTSLPLTCCCMEYFGVIRQVGAEKKGVSHNVFSYAISHRDFRHNYCLNR